MSRLDASLFSYCVCLSLPLTFAPVFNICYQPFEDGQNAEIYHGRIRVITVAKPRLLQRRRVEISRRRQTAKAKQKAVWHIANKDQYSLELIGRTSGWEGSFRLMHLLDLQQPDKSAVTIPNHSGNEIESAFRHHKLSNFQERLLVQDGKVQKDGLSVENTKSFMLTEVGRREEARKREAKWECKNDQAGANLLE